MTPNCPKRVCRRFANPSTPLGTYIHALYCLNCCDLDSLQEGYVYEVLKMKPSLLLDSVEIHRMTSSGSAQDHWIHCEIEGTTPGNMLSSRELGEYALVCIAIEGLMTMPSEVRAS